MGGSRAGQAARMPEHGDAPLPALVRPMLASAGSLPVGRADALHGYELKWDGVRAVAYLDRGRARVLSRTDRDVTVAYPEVGELAAALPGRRLVLDGEVVAFDEAGRPSFGLLQSRMHVARPADVRRARAAVPATYLVFDVLFLDGRDTTDLPYAERRALLESLELSGPSWQVPPSFSGGGGAVLDVARGSGLEGVVAKRLDSRYEAGRRSECWTKVKVTRTQAVVVAGWKPGAGRRSGLPGSLLLGVHVDGALVFAGHVGTGFTDRALRDLAARLTTVGRDSSPYDTEVPREHARDARWVEPVLTGEVEFAEWTRDGRLRHPSWRGLRPDVAPDEVEREP